MSENQFQIVEGKPEVRTFNENNNIVLASRFKRWLATVLNILLLYAFFLIAALIEMLIASLTGFYYQGLFLTLAFCGFLIVELYVMYEHGQTVAKRWLNIKVVDNTSLQQLSFTRYLLREFIDYIFTLLTIPFLIGIIMIFINKRRRSLTDVAVSTVVIKLD